MADDTPETDDGQAVTDSRVEDTDVDSTVDGGSDRDVDASEDKQDTSMAPAHPSRRRAKKPRRRWPWVLSLLLVTGLLITSALMTYEMSQRSQEWSDQVDDITATNYDLGQQIADSEAEVVRLNDKIDLLEQQLSNSKDTVLKLSDEKAQWRDDTEFAQQQVEATEELLTTATSVANALQRCTDGQAELREYITNADDYEPEELTAYQESVTELCGNAEQANTDLQRALTE